MAVVAAPHWDAGVWADTVWAEGVWADESTPVASGLVNSYQWWLQMHPPFYNTYHTITLSDTANFPHRLLCDAIYVGGAGIVQAVQENDAVVPFTAVAGQIIPIKAKRVNNTSTTASLLVALYQK